MKYSDMSYLVVYLFLAEGHQDDWDEEVHHHKGHEHNAGPDEESAKHWIIIQNLRDYEEDNYGLADIMCCYG